VSAASPSSLRGRAGMTLIEVIVVIAIMGVLLSVSVAAIHVVGSGDADPEAALQDVMTEARMLAARSGEPVGILFDAGGGFHIEGGDGATIRRGALPVEAVEPAPLAVRVFPAGTSGGGVIRLRARGEWRTFTIDPVTARPFAR
jgi:prepilin-type N-terminal cleavage/methylation domain-containing protein